MRILILEDEPLVVLHLSQIVADAGFEVVATASSVEQALMEAGRKPIDIALVDIRVKGPLTGLMAGPELAGMGISVIYLTGNYEMALQEGRDHASDLLAKPLVEREVIAALNRAAEKRREIPDIPLARIAAG